MVLAFLVHKGADFYAVNLLVEYSYGYVRCGGATLVGGHPLIWLMNLPIPLPGPNTHFVQRSMVGGFAAGLQGQGTAFPLHNKEMDTSKDQELP